MPLDLCQNFVFRSISLEQMDRISTNFVYALNFILTRSMLGVLPIIFLICNMSEFCFCSIALELGLLQHELRYSGAKVRFSDNSSLRLHCIGQICLTYV